jgi:hypothetical protein
MKRFLVLMLLGMPALLRADISNTALVAYKDAANNSYNAASNIVVIAVTASSACDINGDSAVNALDVQLTVNQALGIGQCSADINRDSLCNVVDVQRVANNVLGGPCVTTP